MDVSELVSKALKDHEGLACRSSLGHPSVKALKDVSLSSAQISELLGAFLSPPELFVLAQQEEFSVEHLYSFARLWHSYQLARYSGYQESLLELNPLAYLGVIMGSRWYFSDESKDPAKLEGSLFMRIVYAAVSSEDLLKRTIDAFNKDILMRTRADGLVTHDFKNADIINVFLEA